MPMARRRSFSTDLGWEKIPKRTGSLRASNSGEPPPRSVANVASVDLRLLQWCRPDPPWRDLEREKRTRRPRRAASTRKAALGRDAPTNAEAGEEEPTCKTNKRHPPRHRLLDAADDDPSKPYAMYTPGPEVSLTSRRRSGRRRRGKRASRRRRGGSDGVAQKYRLLVAGEDKVQGS